MSVTDDKDIYRSAHVLIREHGDRAAIEAALRADKMLARGDLGGLAAWKRILKAVDVLQAKERPEGAPVH